MRRCKLVIGNLAPAAKPQKFPLDFKPPAGNVGAPAWMAQALAK
jgi:hypothetical protein